jgi:mycoredoxin
MEPPAAFAPVPGRLTVYGGSWCIDCHVVTRYLDAQGIAFQWVDLGRDRAAQDQLSAAGYRAIPVVTLPDGRILVEPSTRQLAAALAIGQDAPA